MALFIMLIVFLSSTAQTGDCDPKKLLRIVYPDSAAGPEPAAGARPLQHITRGYEGRMLQIKGRLDEIARRKEVIAAVVPIDVLLDNEQHPGRWGDAKRRFRQFNKEREDLLEEIREYSLYVKDIKDFQEGGPSQRARIRRQVSDRLARLEREWQRTEDDIERIQASAHSYEDFQKLEPIERGQKMRALRIRELKELKRAFSGQ
jgi:hypothetical protein